MPCCKGCAKLVLFRREAGGTSGARKSVAVEARWASHCCWDVGCAAVADDVRPELARPLPPCAVFMSPLKDSGRRVACAAIEISRPNALEQRRGGGRCMPSCKNIGEKNSKTHKKKMTPQRPKVIKPNHSFINPKPVFYRSQFLSERKRLQEEEKEVPTRRVRQTNMATQLLHE